MSSARKESSHSSKSFNSSSENRARDRMSDEDFWDFDLPISRRGRFFQDSSFEDTRSDFDKKVKDILSQWGEDDFLGDKRGEDADLRHTSNLNRYRDLRSSRNLSDDNQAVTVTSKDDAHKIVLDVMDFVAGDVKVKVVGELELVVEGRLEAGTDGGFPRTFRRNFTLPQHTDMDAITSVMSADGILTITAPKKGSRGRADMSSSPKHHASSRESNTESMRSFSSAGGSAGNKGATGGHTDTSTSQRGEQASSSTSEENKSRSGQFSASDFRDVPFKKRGRFFDDSIFEDSRWDFDKKVKDILSQWGEDDFMGDKRGEDADLRHTSNLNRYRDLRSSRNLSDDNQAVTVTSKDDAHKIVLDVMDFVAGDVKVKVVGELELVVEGRLEAGTNGGSPRTFRRNFTLPQHTDMDAITSVMSADGILTITAPKTATRSKGDGKEGHVNVANRESLNDSRISSSHNASSNMSSMKCKVANVQENEKLKNDSKQELSQSTQTVSKTNTSTDAPQVTASTQQSSQNITYSQERTNESSPKTQVTSLNNESEENKILQPNPKDNVSDVAMKVMSSEEHCGGRSIALPITTRGQFFNDSFFEDTWKNYQDAVRDVLARWDDHSSSMTTDDMTCYRKLRTRDMRDENQAVTTSEDESSYKYVVDVHDFTEGGEVSVNLLDEGQLVVEGQLEREEGGSRACDHFLREFALPHDVQQEDITAVMSSDGVLTIIAPRKKKLLREGGETRESQTAETVRMSSETQVKELSQNSAATSVKDTSSTAQEYLKEEDAKEIVIPVIMGDSSVTSLKVSDASSQIAQQEKSVSFEGQENFNDEERHKKSAGGKDCGFTGETETDAVHRRLDEDQCQAAEAASEGEQAGEAEKKKRVVKRVCREEDEAYRNRLLHIKDMGNFTEDEHFADYHDNYMTAVKDVLRKFHVPVDESSGEIAAYRGLRQRDLKIENQAAHIDDKPRSQTIVLDVFDFLEGEMTAEVVDGRELIVRGHTQRRHGSSLTTLSFLKPIPLPEDADLQGIAAFVSSDGVLIINIPKLEECYEVIDLSKQLPLDNRTRVGTPSDGSLNLEGRVYRMSPHRHLADHRAATRDRSSDRL